MAVGAGSEALSQLGGRQGPLPRLTGSIPFEDNARPAEKIRHWGRSTCRVKT